MHGRTADMKIVMTDNFARESRSDFVVAINITNQNFANTMRDALNDKFGGEESPMYFVVREDDEKDYVFIP